MIKYAAVLIVFFSFGYNLLVKYLQTQKPKSPVLTERIRRINPRGQKSRILLQDGSTVSLNAGSKLTYSTDFNKKSRNIHLEGEAYFEVAKNPKKPFKVYTDGLIITAIGTSFNVQAYADNKIEKVALNTGKVKIETMNAIKRYGETFLDPGQMVVYDGEKGNLRMADFKGQDPFSWKDGKIVFYHASFEEVIEILSRWFNVDIKVTGKLPREWDYSSSYENETLENILESLKFSEKIDYSLSGSEVEIKI
jgi:ferric-dicitrate binding protein FerR (iron transport regulator)